MSGIREIVVLSGKGGTGKTSLVAAFSQLAAGSVVVDCDVDAANLHLLLSAVNERSAPEGVYGGFISKVDDSACTGCGRCVNECRFDALTLVDGRASLIEYRCEGCGVCEIVCPHNAISLHAKVCGSIVSYNTRYGVMVSGRLGIAQGNSGKLVSSVRNKANQMAESDERSLIITDGPPGVGCPVIATLSGIKAVVVVTEPTISGVHDLERVVSLCKHFEVPTFVVVNKWDLNPEYASFAEAKSRELGAIPVGRIGYDQIFTDAMLHSKTVLEQDDKSAPAQAIREIWNNINSIVSGR